LHQESFNGVQFRGINGMRACEIIDDAPRVTVFVNVLARCAARFAHAPHVRMGEPDILSASWSLSLSASAPIARFVRQSANASA
jgi:hypothetical protein